MDQAVPSRHPRQLLLLALRRPVGTVFVVALAARLLAVVMLAPLAPDANPDEYLFWHLGGQWVAGETGTWSGYHDAVFDNGRLFIMTLGVLDLLPGASVVTGRVAVAVLGAMAAASVVVLGRRLSATRLGLVAGLLVGLWPSQVAFSAYALREAMLWLVLVVLAIIAAEASQTRGRLLLATGAGVAVCLFALTWLRPSTAMVAALALVLAAIVSSAGARLVRFGGAVVLFLAVPALGGLGVAGSEVLAPDRVAAVQEHRTEGSAAMACTDLGHDAPATSVVDAFDRVVVAAPASLLGPYPWQEVCSTLGQVAKAESLLFGLLLLSAGVGLVSRRVPVRPMAFGLIFLLGMVLLFGLAQDNVGTAFRHRGQIHWVVALFGAAGLIHLGGWLSASSGADRSVHRPQREDDSEAREPGQAEQ